MKLINSIYIARPAGAVWAFLEDPANMLRWNPKVKHVSPSSFSEPQHGYRYAITYQMHERARAAEFLAEFTHFEPFSKLVIRHTGGLAPHDRVIEEIYELSEREGGTFLTQTILIENSGINLFFRFLIWIIQRWGKPAGKPYLETLKEIVESDPV
ncbi:MAG: SRPBCC family protein [Nitrospirae bacterium]|nr:SRPBCC family protein [Nitrospirota bacterium]